MNKIFTLLLLIFLAACQEKPNPLEANSSIIFKSNDLKTTVNLESKELSIISDSLLFPANLIISKNQLLISELKSDFFMHVIKIPEDEYLNQYGSKGRAPGEILTPGKFSVAEGGLIYLHGLDQKKILEFETDTLQGLLKYKGEHQMKPEIDAFYGFSVLNEKLFFTDANNLENRLYSSNLDGTNSHGYGDLTELGDEVSKSHYQEVLRKATSSRLDNYGHLFVFGYHALPFLEIFDLKSDEWISIAGPETFIPTKNNVRSIKFYSSVRITEKYIYALYNGRKDDANADQNCYEIYVFNHKGNPVRKYKLDRGVYDFAVYNDEIIYGIGGDLKDLEIKLLRFEI